MTTATSSSGPTQSTSMASVSQHGGGGLGGGLDEASTASHASSSRFTGTNHGAGPQARQQYQPLSMADALARAGQDQIRALDQLLAERNKLCLELNKLTTENMRLWNLMKRIRRENEELKSNVNVGGTSARTSPLSNASVHSSSNLYGASGTGSSGLALGASTPSHTVHDGTLTASSTAPTLVYSSAGPASTLTASASRGQAGEYEPSGLHAPEEDLLESRGSFSASDPPHGPSSSSSHQPQTPPSAAMQLSESASSSAATAAAGLGIDANRPTRDADFGVAASTADSSQSNQQASIIQQRAAAQAQRLAQLQLGGAGEDSVGRRGSQDSHELDAIEGSSIAASEDVRDGVRASGDNPSSARAGAAPPLYVTSPKPSERSQTWAADSPRNSFAPRLDASMLPYLSLSITGTNIRPSDRGKEVVSFYVAIEIKPPAGRMPQHRSWRVEKTFSDVLALDARVKQKHGKSATKRLSGVPLPDQSMFKDHAPSKVDRRKAMLEQYLKTLLSVPLHDTMDFCTFLCTDAVPPKLRDPDALTKDGFLTKKGQNLGRWVTRWYVLGETSLDHYESRGGLHLGSINIRGAQIGRQQKSATSESDENSYRHAFLILETKPTSSPNEQRQIVRHVLCAESDEERDDWVDVLVRAIGEADNRDRAPDDFDAAPVDAPSMTTAVSQSAFAASPNDTNGAGLTKPAGASANGKRQLDRNLSEKAYTSTPRSPNAKVSSLQPRIGSSSDGRSPDLAVGTSPSAGGPSRSRSDAGLVTTNEDKQQAHHHQQQQYPTDDRGLQLSAGTSSSRPYQGPPALGTASSSNHQLHSPTSRYPPQSSRPPPRSTSQDVGRSSGGAEMRSSSSVDHGVSLDAGTRRPSSPDATGFERSIHTSNRPNKDRMKPSISGPMNGTPIPSGYKFGGKDEVLANNVGTASETKRRFWHRFGGGGHDKSSQPRNVFGVPLAESIAVSNIFEGLELPSVVYRCIEYLEYRNAALEEGIYRLSGSSAVIKSLKDRFNAQGDVNLLAPSEPYYDPHAIAGLLKQFLRELPSSVLTREMHLDFMRVNEIADRRERVNELGNLVSMLPLANYSLLRTLCSHLIKVIERSDVNKMTMRNVGIVFSPTLGIPAGVFALFLTEFDWVFYTDAKGEPAPRTIDEDILAPDESELGLGPSHDDSHEGDSSIDTRHGKTHASRNNRNSLSYNEAEADRLLGGPQARNRLSTFMEDAVDASAAENLIDATTSANAEAEAFDEQITAFSPTGERLESNDDDGHGKNGQHQQEYRNPLLHPNDTASSSAGHGVAAHRDTEQIADFSSAQSVEAEVTNSMPTSNRQYTEEGLTLPRVAQYGIGVEQH